MDGNNYDEIRRQMDGTTPPDVKKHIWPEFPTFTRAHAPAEESKPVEEPTPTEDPAPVGHPEPAEDLAPPSVEQPASDPFAMSAEDRAFWDKQSGKTSDLPQTPVPAPEPAPIIPSQEPDQLTQPQPTFDSQPAQRQRMKDALQQAREHGKEVKGEGSVFDRLIRAKDRAKSALSKITTVLIEKGQVVTKPIEDTHALLVGLRDSPTIREQVTDIAVETTREVIDIPFSVAQRGLELMIATPIRIGDRSFVPLDEAIKTASAVESGIKTTARNAMELAMMTARGIRNRLQDTIDIVHIAHNITQSRLMDNIAKDARTVRAGIDAVQTGASIAIDILRKLEDLSIDTYNGLEKKGVNLEALAKKKRRDALPVLTRLFNNQRALFGIRDLASTEPAPNNPLSTPSFYELAQRIKPNADQPQADKPEAFPTGPVTSSSDPRFEQLSPFEKAVILNNEKLPPPASALPTDHPLNQNII